MYGLVLLTLACKGGEAPDTQAPDDSAPPSGDDTGPPADSGDSGDTGPATGELSLAEAWATLPGSEGEALGGELAIGDLDGDGAADLVLGARWRGEQVGRVYVVAGPIAEGEQDMSFGASSWDGTGSYVELGADVDAGDLDGDGVAELVAGAPGADGSGLVYVLAGQTDGPGSVLDRHGALAGGPGEKTGTSVAIGPDVDGDGLADLVVGAPGSPHSSGGRVYLQSGLPSGDGSLGVAPSVVSSRYGDLAGSVVASVGDTDGDGLGDVWIGAPNVDEGAGDAWLARGGWSGELDLEDGDLRFDGERGSLAGHRVGAAGDFDGDGLADLLVSAPTHDGLAEQAGAAYVLLGHQTGELDPADAYYRALGREEAARVGSDLVSLGDLDGDGRAELLVCAAGATVAKQAASGACLVVPGGTEGAPLVEPGDGGTWITGAEADLRAGHRVVGGQDLRGDGSADLVVATGEGLIDEDGFVFALGGAALGW